MTQQTESNIPASIFHYHLPDKKAFLNLSDLTQSERTVIVEDLEKRRQAGEIKRWFPDWYFLQRAEAEANMRQVLEGKGESISRKAPHYFSLGRSKGIEMGYGDKYALVEIPVQLVKETAWFTIGDNIWTFSQAYTDLMQWENRWYHGQLFRYDELVDVIAQIGLDLGDPASMAILNVPCVEAMIWSDEDLESVLVASKESK
ncbi:MAG: hypothetical protein AAF206_03825 [Bacteroidota bacterium]